jgi:ribonucleoside-diphosphate reductase subunit M1
MSSVENYGTVDLINTLSDGLDYIDKTRVCNLVNKFGLYEAARIIGYDVSHYSYHNLAGRLAIQYLKNNSPKTLLDYANLAKTVLNGSTYEYMVKHHVELQKAIDRNEHNDYDHDWFSANTMITMYSLSLKFGGKGMETPQHTWMRIAIQLYSNNSIEDVIAAYEEMSEGWYTPASPTIFNSGLKVHQLSSCFLLKMGDSLESIYETIKRGALILKDMGGLGFDISDIRHSEISDRGYSSGIVPMLQVVNDTVRYVDQLGKRKGVANMFLRSHHIDIESFIDLSKKVGERYVRAHDINTTIWTSWIFWERIRTGGKWTLFCPARVPELNKLYGKDFTEAYITAENDPNILPHHKKVVDARELYDRILGVQRESGMPFLMNGDACNIKSNHRHNGYISCSNLCLEIVHYTDEDTVGVCNLHSLSLRMYGIKPIDFKELNFEKAARECINFPKLGYMSRKATKNLNRVVDNNSYPLDKYKNGVLKPGIINKSNKQHKALGLGCSGFAELLHILDLPFEDPRVNVLNKMVFACIYWNALVQSVQTAIIDGKYETYHGSPASQGKLQFDLWKEEFEALGPNKLRKEEDDKPVNPVAWGQEPIYLYAEDGKTIIDTVLPTWNDLKRCILKYGLANSLLIALMPTATTAQVRRNCETIEAHQNNMYSRKVLKCSYPVLNRYLVSDLDKCGAWNENTVEYIRIKNGSVQGFKDYVKNNTSLFPNYNGNDVRVSHIEKKYKTMWEISQKVFMHLAAERGRYIDQSSSTNLYIKDCTNDKLRAAHLYANDLGAKTIMYYLRQSGAETIKFTADPSMIQHIKGLNVEVAVGDDKTLPITADKVQLGKEMLTERFDTGDVCINCT